MESTAQAQEAPDTQDAQDTQGHDNQPQEQAPVQAQDAPEEHANVWDDPDAAKAEIERLRAENAKDRTTARDNAAKAARDALVQDLGKALGLVDDKDQAPDVDALTRAAADREAEAKQARVELAVYRAAGKHDADADALLDSRAFLAKLDGIDPADTDKIAEAIKAAVNDNPKLKTARAARQGGAEFTGGTGERRTKASDLNEAVAAYYR